MKPKPHLLRHQPLPEFEYRASEATPTQFTREESEQAQLEVPYFDAQPQLQVNPNTQGLPITGWPSDETIGASIGRRVETGRSMAG